jgi:hypothetical protein
VQGLETSLPADYVLRGEIVDTNVTREKMRPQKESLLRSNVVIMDCTASAKPSMIAYYQLTDEYALPLELVKSRKSNSPSQK